MKQCNPGNRLPNCLIQDEKDKFIEMIKLRPRNRLTTLRC